MAFRPEQHRAREAPARSRGRQHHSWGGSSALYGHQWRRSRAYYLSQHPMCAMSGCDQPSNEVDHIRPHKGDLRLFWDSTNWQALCKACHSRKTMAELNTDRAVSL